MKTKRVEDFTKEERAIYDRGRKDWSDVTDELAESVSDIYTRGYKMGYRDGKLGRKRIPHKTLDGWCCACEYDQMCYEEKIRKIKTRTR